MGNLAGSGRHQIFEIYLDQRYENFVAIKYGNLPE